MVNTYEICDNVCISICLIQVALHNECALYELSEQVRGSFEGITLLEVLTRFCSCAAWVLNNGKRYLAKACMVIEEIVFYCFAAAALGRRSFGYLLSGLSLSCGFRSGVCETLTKYV